MKSQGLYHAGIATFMGSRQVPLEELEPDTFVVAGVPYDYASGSRPGARWGPRAIRQSSLYFSRFLHVAPNQGFVDVASGKGIPIAGNLPIVDLGDMDVYPMNLAQTMKSISNFVKRMVEANATPIILGGDHFVTYPCFQGYCEAFARKGTRGPSRIGYVQLDSHFDMWDDRPVWGKYSHGSTARRIAEYIDPRNVLIAGVSGIIDKEVWDFVQENSVTVVTLNQILTEGLLPVLQRAVTELAARVDSIYLSVDIDIVNAAFAPGTGATSLEGLSSSQLLQAIALLAEYPVGALDVVEVAPNYDPSERTQRLAAATIVQYILHKRAIVK